MRAALIFAAGVIVGAAGTVGGLLLSEWWTTRNIPR